MSEQRSESLRLDCSDEGRCDGEGCGGEGGVEGVDLVLVGRVDRRRRERAKGEESEKGGELGGERGKEGESERGRDSTDLSKEFLKFYVVWGREGFGLKQ